MFKSAGKAEIIRSHQKDEFYLTYLRGLTADVVHRLFGPRLWIAWRKELEIAADLGYFFLTTGSGFQTIGEEYVNIIQVGHSKRQIPSTLTRGIMVMLHVLTPHLLRKLFDWMERKLRSHDSHEIPMETREFLLKYIPVVKTVVVYAHRLHMALFYLRGIFYHLAKRINGVHYVQFSAGPPKTDDSLSSSFKVLGWITLAQLIGSGLIGTYTYIKDKTSNSSAFNRSIDDHESDVYVSEDRKCSLCLEERKHSSVTPCGHLFCWNCIHDWCSSKAECPLCREKIEEHRIVPLQNMDPT